MVVHHFQNMRMPAYEYVRMEFLDKRPGPPVIMAGRPSDMGHKDGDPLKFQNLLVRIFQTYVLAVAVARDAYQRLEFPYVVGEGESPAEIARMPYHVTRSEKLLEFVAEDSVSIAYEADVHLVPVSVGILLLPVPGIATHLLNAVLCLPSQFTECL